MLSSSLFSSRLLILSVALVGVAGTGVPVQGQKAPGVTVGGVHIPGIVDDWSHRHLIFADPGTESDALWNGTHEQWLRVVHDPRYILQQLKRGGVVQGPAAGDVARIKESRWFGEPSVSGNTGPHRDWAVSLGTGTVAQNMFPAKYTFDVTATPNCTSDFVVYGLNVAATTGGQANLVALNQLYSGTGTPFCGQAAASPYWAYNATFTTAGKISTSPALSLDGSKVIYIESGGATGAYLHVLEWNAADGGTPTASKAPTNKLAAGSGLSSCPTGGASCLVSILLPTTTQTITYSSPYYDYADDIVYVGDDNGTLYKVTPVLGSGTPVVTRLVVSAGNALSGPVYDSVSGNVFFSGTTSLFAVKASTFALQTHSALGIGDTGTCTNPNNILHDTPIVDSANNWVYDWVTTGTDATHTVVVQAHTTGTNSPSGTSWTAASTQDIGEGDDGCDSSGLFPTWSPTFDNTYYNGTITSGHMWVCGRETGGSQPELWEIPTNGTGGSFGTAVASGTTLLDAVAHGVCSPITEIYNGATDRIFMGEGLAGSFGRLYGFTVSGATPTAISGSPITYPTSTAATSAIVVDNVSSDAQASSIYFTTQATSTGGAPCTTGAYCAIKLTQSALQ